MKKMRSLAPLVGVLLVTAALAAGCGSSSKSTGGGNVSPAVSPTVNSAVDQCLKSAKQVQDASARKTAEAACNAAKTGNVSKVKSAAKAQCLDAVKQIPDSAMQQKNAAKARCNAIK
jgi:hypothetical protein